eukprot:TRINITY_DN2255_c0_g1_i1.p1 TRINITY_DN2255_c0_g1~~TRINITY_DN2255_c0_g1_i1.p1  ORF type:complete len:312 (-),score=25.94 TRINITY_DN2255_c0_g1_i1:38-973(-)
MHHISQNTYSPFGWKGITPQIRTPTHHLQSPTYAGHHFPYHGVQGFAYSPRLVASPTPAQRIPINQIQAVALSPAPAKAAPPHQTTPRHNIYLASSPKQNFDNLGAKILEKQASIITLRTRIGEQHKSVIQMTSQNEELLTNIQQRESDIHALKQVLAELEQIHSSMQADPEQYFSGNKEFLLDAAEVYSSRTINTQTGLEDTIIENLENDPYRTCHDTSDKRRSTVRDRFGRKVNAGIPKSPTPAKPKVLEKIQEEENSNQKERKEYMVVPPPPRHSGPFVRDSPCFGKPCSSIRDSPCLLYTSPSPRDS